MAMDSVITPTLMMMATVLMTGKTLTTMATEKLMLPMHSLTTTTNGWTLMAMELVTTEILTTMATELWMLPMHSH